MVGCLVGWWAGGRAGGRLVTWVGGQLAGWVGGWPVGWLGGWVVANSGMCLVYGSVWVSALNFGV